MMRSKIVLAAMLACVPLAPQAAELTYTFDSVTSIEYRSSETRITGVLVNETTPTTVTLPWSPGAQYSRCESLFGVVLSLPGVYSLTVVNDSRVPPDPTMPSLLFNRCSATLKP